MQLLTYTDYAMRILLYVGSHPDGPVPAATIATAYDISLDHVAKAAKTLTREGFLRATRGARGGVQLARAASEIRVGDVVRVFEGDRAPVSCLRSDRSGECVIEPSCRLRAALQRAERAFLAELDAHTLADLLVTKPRLVKLLARGAA